MSNNHQRWLLEQLPQWEREGLLTPEAARTLRDRHAVDDSQPGAAQIVMGALGALLIGSGLIAIIGFNWDDFTRPVRLLFAFVPLLLAQLFSFRALQRGAATAPWVRETAALLQALTTGACIAIVSQIYNLGGEWPDFLFWWLLLSLPLVWVLRSSSVAIFYLIGIAVWSVNQVEHGRPWYDSPLLYPVLLLGLLPWWPGWKMRTSLSLSVRWVMTLSAIFGLCSAAVFACSRSQEHYGYYEDSFFWLWTLTAAALTLLPLSQNCLDEPTRRKPQVLLGGLWLLGYGVAATFRDASGDILRGVPYALRLPWCWGLLTVLAAFVALAFLRRRWAVLAIASISLLPLLMIPLHRPDVRPDGTLLSWLALLHLAAIGITLIVLEFAGKKGAPRLGATLLSVLIIARMADSDLSLLAKGVAFIGVGIAFLGFNILMGRLLKQKAAAPLPA